MACLSFLWLEQLLILLVLIVAAVTIVNLLVPWLLAQIGGPPDGSVIVTVLRVIVWAIVAIFIIYLVFDLLSCLFGGGLALPRLR